MRKELKIERARRAMEEFVRHLGLLFSKQV